MIEQPTKAMSLIPWNLYSNSLKHSMTFSGSCFNIHIYKNGDTPPICLPLLL